MNALQMPQYQNLGLLNQDDLGDLRCVIQPAGVAQLSTVNYQPSTSLLAEQCFQYEYDARRRMITKQVPGAGPVYMVYDARDRLVMAQDANMRAAGNWLVTAYDNLDRPVQTGLLADATPLATHLSNAYTSTAYPSSVGDQLTQTHYDDYVGLPTGLLATYSNTWDANFVTATNNGSFPYQQKPAQNGTTTTKGMVTWASAKVLDNSATPTYLSTATIYDNHGRPVQVQGKNISGGTDVATTEYNWMGQPLIVVQKQDKQGALPQVTVTVTSMDYDSINRPLRAYEQLGNTYVAGGAMNASRKVFSQRYDALGQLKNKTLGTNLDTMAYDYNIRGWLLGVNRAYLTDVSAADPAMTGESFTTPRPAATAGRFFGFDLGYDRNGVIGSYTPQYNGNISGMVWKSAHDAQVRKYDFGYDPVNRLLNADFNQYTTGSFNKTALVDFSAGNLAYDANGNILGMKQMGLVSNAVQAIDQLRYTYQTGSNKLQQVFDTANNNASLLGDFKYDAAAKTGTDYAYDGNGNLTSDANKKITGITYNHLNLPQQINVDGKGGIPIPTMPMATN